ncbi:hypothetical protein FKM82_028310 [Ascaphus truei]
MNVPFSNFQGGCVASSHILISHSFLIAIIGLAAPPSDRIRLCLMHKIPGSYSNSASSSLMGILCMRCQFTLSEGTAAHPFNL